MEVNLGRYAIFLSLYSALRHVVLALLRGSETSFSLPRFERVGRSVLTKPNLGGGHLYHLISGDPTNRNLCCKQPHLGSPKKKVHVVNRL